MKLTCGITGEVSESSSSSSDSDIEPVSKRKTVFSTVRHPPTTSLPGTPTSKSRLEQTSPHGNKLMNEVTPLRPSKDEPLVLLSVTSSDNDLPPPSRRKRNEAPIILSSNEDSDNIIADIASPHRNSRNQQSTHIYSPTVNARRFIFGGSSGYAPISSSRVPKAVTQPTSKSSLVSPQQTRSSSALKSPSTFKKNQLSSRMSQKPKIHPSVDPSSGSDDSDFIIKRGSPLKRRSNRVTNSRYVYSSSGGDDSSVITTALDDSNQNPLIAKHIGYNDKSEDETAAPLRRKRLLRPLDRSLQESKKASHQQAEDDIQEDLEAIEESGKFHYIENKLQN